MCWFALVRNMRGLLDTSHDPITADENLANKAYFCMGVIIQPCRAPENS